MIISIINNTQLLKEDVQRVIRAINRQLSEDFKRYWHRQVEVRLEGWTGEQPSPTTPIDMRGDAVIYLWDQDDVNNALGYHDLTASGVPFGFVFTRLSEQLNEPWSVTFSHEVLEMAMDPEVNLLAQGPHPDPNEGGRIVYHWYELCDAVQGETYEIDGVTVANFVLPLYFTQREEHQNHNDFLGIKLPSFGVAKGGYVGFFDPKTGKHDTWSHPRDRVAAHRLKLKQGYQGISRSDRHLGKERSVIHDKNLVHCDAIVFEIRLQAIQATKSDAFKYAQRLVTKVLGKNWRVWTTPQDPNEFDAIYKGKTAIGFKEAWELAHSLAEDASVVFAEPSMSFPVWGESDDPEAENLALRASSGGENIYPSETDDPKWGLKLCRVPEAWEIIKKANKRPGAGVRIGHPDSGYRHHDEMDSARVLTGIDYDFLDDDEDTADISGNHGLSTASVIMSGQDAQGDRIAGPALHAEIVPLRVTEPRSLWILFLPISIPAPVLLSAGMRRLRDAIDYAVKIGCSVISISLGGPPSYTVWKAVRRATDTGVIVLAAAGNTVGFVVWPARYEGVIAVAGCNIEKKPWSGSCSGKAVDVAAPAEGVWRAYYDKQGCPDVARSEGTSYAVALTAGIAAIWVAFHGHKKLVKKYGADQIYHVFRKLLRKTANTNHKLPSKGFGAGIVDANKLIKEPLPKPTSIRKATTANNGLRPAIREYEIDKLFNINPDNLNDGLAQELLSAYMLGAFDKPARKRTAVKFNPTFGVSHHLGVVLKQQSNISVSDESR